MKRLAIIVVMALMSLTASANSVRYFTLPQAQRTVRYLDAQNELMLYCGYDYEIETYVLINEIWMERVNSAYYEIWVYGYDAYTGDEIIMPLDLQCVWLYSAGRMYNAAQYLRFHATVRTPGLNWYIPPYNPFPRRPHYAGYVRTYHYQVHTPGWRPPTPPPHGYGPHTQPPLPPYYMRTPQTPPPAPTTGWTPGVEHPHVSPSTPSTPSTGNHSNSSVPTARPSGIRTTGDQSNGTATSPRTSGTRPSGNTTTGTRNTGTTTTRSTNNTPTRTNTGTTTSEPRPTGTGTTTETRTSGTRSTGTTTGTRTTGTRNTGTRTSGNTNTGTRTSGTTTGTRTSGTSTGTRSTGTSNTNTEPRTSGTRSTNTRTR